DLPLHAQSQVDRPPTGARTLRQAARPAGHLMASVAELKEKHAAATASVNSLRERLRQRRQTLLDTDVEKYSKAQGRTAVSFNPTDLVCCRTLQGHSGKVRPFG
uniref:Uncharacterized protein n=1 Tax=Aegilops tauschii subsp. strangulata TaxID=200361 RepID=A0A453H1S4_AEGTS